MTVLMLEILCVFSFLSNGNNGWLVCNEYMPQFLELKFLGESVFMNADELKENIELIRPNKLCRISRKTIDTQRLLTISRKVWIGSGKSMRETYPAIFEQEMRPLLPAEVIELLGSVW